MLSTSNYQLIGKLHKTFKTFVILQILKERKRRYFNANNYIIIFKRALLLDALNTMVSNTTQYLTHKNDQNKLMVY